MLAAFGDLWSAVFITNISPGVADLAGILEISRESAETIPSDHTCRPQQDAAMAGLCQILTDAKNTFTTTQRRLVYRRVGPS